LRADHHGREIHSLAIVNFLVETARFELRQFDRGFQGFEGVADQRGHRQKRARWVAFQRWFRMNSSSSSISRSRGEAVADAGLAQENLLARAQDAPFLHDGVEHAPTNSGRSWKTVRSFGP